ncbi:ParM/StbA family protein [Clostridium tertium]|jgi:plasmid segregation protein ParM|uniref:ParM/StbA family protein n=1 Tax=Clostridium tertium TaxID=1559 RepID=UPI000BE3E492|nr:ParM/StbA family protein [Clostridium tertium]
METIGLDFGNCNLKTSKGIIIPTKIINGRNILNSGFEIKINGNWYTVGDGDFDTTLDKTEKEYFIPFLAIGIGLSIEKDFVRLVTGLPINQYKNKKEKLLKIIEDNKILDFSLNGVDKKIYIAEAEIFPEGVATYYSLSPEYRRSIKEKDIVILDIGGRTTNIVWLKAGLKRSVYKYVSLESGIINIYSEVIKQINSLYTLGLEIEEAESILKNGLEVDGEKQDLNFVRGIIKNNIDKVFKELNINYPVRTCPLLVTGGGGGSFYKAIKKRYNTAVLVENNILSNAIGYERVGEKLWLG